MSSPRVIHCDDLPWTTGGHGSLFEHRRRRLGREAGGDRLGCSMMELDPGKTAWPFHYHHANEEAIYVLSGSATLRCGTERVPVRAGDYIALPAGPDDAHQLTNTGHEPVRYLVMSTMRTPDVCVYPDADKVGVVGALTDAEGRPQRVVTFPRDAEVGYWDGEDDGRAAGPRAEATPDPAPDPAARAEQLEQMVESDLDALKRKLARESGADSASTPGPTPAPDPAPDRAAADADLDELKRRLDDS